MKNKHNLKTVRLSAKESNLVVQFLAENPAIESFSALARIAILDFIVKRGSIPLRPIVEEEKASRGRPSFIWDYDLTEGQVREILSGPVRQRFWLVARILEHARFDEVWRFLTCREIERDIPGLRMDRKVKEHWKYALRRWKRAA